MYTAIKEGKPIIGVMETDAERNKPDFALEKQRCMEVRSEHSAEVVKLLDEVCQLTTIASAA